MNATTPTGPRRCRRALLGLTTTLLLATALALSACGGGGGGGDDGNGTDPNPPTNDDDDDQGNGDAGPTGSIWHNNYALDLYSGTSRSALDGTPTQHIDAYVGTVPWFDGSQYITSDYEPYDHTEVNVHDASDGSVRYTAFFDNLVDRFRPSPADPHIIMLRWGEDSVSPWWTAIVDMSTIEVLQKFEPTGLFNWRPDGRYIRMLPDGRLMTAEINGTETQIGTLTPPTDWEPAGLRVSPDGTRLAIPMAHYEASYDDYDEWDVWVADIDGSHLERYSASKVGFNPQWSPDGRYLALEFDTGTLCNGGTCLGGCDLMYADADARGVTGLDALHDAEAFEVTDEDGDTTTLGCEMLAWTQ